MHEQLETAGMHTRHHRDRQAVIEATDGPWREHETEVDLALRERLGERLAVSRNHVFDVGEPLRTQQLLGHKLRRQADRIFKLLTLDPDRGRLQRRLLGEGSSRTSESRGTGGGQAGQEIAAILPDVHWKPSVFSSAGASGGRYAFSSRLSSLRKRQSVPAARSSFGLEVMKPTSCICSA